MQYSVPSPNPQPRLPVPRALAAVPLFIMILAACGHRSSSPAGATPASSEASAVEEGSEQAGAAEPAAEPDAEPASEEASPEEASELFHPHNPLGVNTGVGLVHQAMMRHYDFSNWPEKAARDAEHLEAVGARWYRAHNAGYPGFDQATIAADRRDLAHHDLVVRLVQSAEIDMLLVIGRVRGIASCTKFNRELPDSLVPRPGQEEQRYRAYVKRIVERYDHDGVDDMPGLAAPIRWYQIGNEHDLHHATCAKEGVEYATPEQMVELTRITREAMREASPESRLVFSMAFGERVEREFRWGQRVLAHEGGEVLEYVDAVNLHDYSQKVDLQRNRIDALVALTGGDYPIWITETSVPSDTRAVPGWNLERHARVMVRLVMSALSTGHVERMFWHTLHDGPIRGRRPGGREPFASNALWRCPEWERGPGGLERCQRWEMKPGGRAFYLLSAVLEDWREVEPLPAGAGWRIRYRSGPDALVLEAGAGTFDASPYLDATSVQVWDLVEQTGSAGARPQTVSTSAVARGPDPLLVVTEGVALEGP